MENALLSSPANPHFFQPLLSGFQSHPKIPVTFFSKHIEGKHEGKTVELRSDSSDRTWKVKMEGHRLTEGWKEFAKAHDLRIYDVVIFRQEGDMLFHVTAFGTSCCEIQYAPSGIHVKVKEESEEVGESSRREKESSSKPTCFSQYVTATNLSRGAVGVPLDFARRNGLNKGRRVIALRNQEGKTWESKLKTTRSGQVFICRNWRSFCTASKLKIGDSFQFKLLENTETPVFQLCSLSKVKPKKETLSESEEDNVVDKTETPRFVKITTTASSLEIGKQNIPVHFTRANKLNKPGKIVLVDKDKVEWSMKLNQDSRSGTMYIMGGTAWKSFCAANEVVVGESLTLELIRQASSIQGFESESIVSTLSTSVQHSEVTTDGEEDDEVDDEEREGTGMEFCPDRSMKKIVKLPLPTQELQRLAVNLQEQVVVDGECITLFSGEPAFLPASSYRFPKPSQNSLKFFSKHIEGKHEGWKEFAKAHDLRVGDVVIFRQEGDMLFHVTAFGTSCCELQYVLSGSHDVKEEGDVIGESSRREKESSPSLTCFNQTVTAGSLIKWSSGCAFRFRNKGRHKVVLMNQEGESWESEVKCKRSGQVFICRSWRIFCTASRLEVGDSLQFKLLQNTETPVFQLSSHLKVKREKGTLPEEDSVVDKIEKPRFVTITPSASNLEIGKQYLPVHFTRANKLNRPGKIVLVDKNKVEWSMKLKKDIRSGTMYIINDGATTVQNKDSRTQENSSSETEPVEKIEA
ncbi:hypothetical protein Bca52824_089420 [Brassica carinata]|uniref:TF-B3 domain-containing protein n=1 Tax=Brassica carinata TaxID=52824 RepID=A0A8X7PFN1_BRACI|nr:hypothetical protein Bca52824_089420 [Brassica carinata]